MRMNVKQLLGIGIISILLVITLAPHIAEERTKGYFSVSSEYIKMYNQNVLLGKQTPMWNPTEEKIRIPVLLMIIGLSIIGGVSISLASERVRGIA